MAKRKKADKKPKINNTLKIAILAIISVLIVVGGAVFFFYHQDWRLTQEEKTFKSMVSNLKTSSRKAEILIKSIVYDEENNKLNTTVGFLEYNVRGRSLPEKVFTFTGNTIQLQTMSIYFDDFKMEGLPSITNKTARIFWKIYLLDGKDTQEKEITPINSVPLAYRIAPDKNATEEALWKTFWEYALSPDEKENMQTKTTQIKAKGKAFMPGTLYTITINRDDTVDVSTSFMPDKGRMFPFNI